MKSEAKWDKSFASVNAISMSPLRGKTLICLLVLFSADSFFTSDNSCACVKDVHPYVQQLNKLWTKQSHLSPPTPLQLCLSEAVLRILSVCKLFELGSFCLLAWCLWDPSVLRVQLGWSARFPAMAPRGSRTTAVALSTHQPNVWEVNPGQCIPLKGFSHCSGLDGSCLKLTGCGLAKKQCLGMEEHWWSGAELGTAGEGWSRALMLARGGCPPPDPFPLDQKYFHSLCYQCFSQLLTYSTDAFKMGAVIKWKVHLKNALVCETQWHIFWSLIQKSCI